MEQAGGIPLGVPPLAGRGWGPFIHSEAFSHERGRVGEKYEQFLNALNLWYVQLSKRRHKEDV